MIRSLSFRLFAVFILSSAIMAYALIQGTTFVLSLQDPSAVMLNDSRFAPPKFGKYLKRLGRPPSIEVARKLHAEKNFDIIIFDKGTKELFQTSEKLPSLAVLKNHIKDRGEGLNLPLMDRRGPPPGKPPRHRPHGRLGVYNQLLFNYLESPKHTVVILVKDNLANFLSLSSKIKLAVLFLIALGSFFTSLYLLKALLRPLDKLVKAVKELGDGNLAVEVKGKQTREFEIITDEFNRMVKKVGVMLESRDYLLRAINHELRAPLARMRINIEMIEDKKTRENLSQDIDELKELLENLLEIEKVQSETQLKSFDFNLIDLLAEVVSKYKSQANIDFKYNENEVLWHADPVKIKILIKNLLENAIKYNDKQIKRLEIKCHKTGGEITIQVVDNGIGIAPENIEKLCDPFYRVELSRNKKYAGLGLGLNISKEIIKRHHGQLKIESNLGEGSIFTLKFPTQYK